MKEVPSSHTEGQILKRRGGGRRSGNFESTIAERDQSVLDQLEPNKQLTYDSLRQVLHPRVNPRVALNDLRGSLYRLRSRVERDGDVIIAQRVGGTLNIVRTSAANKETTIRFLQAQDQDIRSAKEKALKAQASEREADRSGPSVFEKQLAELLQTTRPTGWQMTRALYGPDAGRNELIYTNRHLQRLKARCEAEGKTIIRRGGIWEIVTLDASGKPVIDSPVGGGIGEKPRRSHSRKGEGAPERRVEILEASETLKMGEAELYEVTNRFIHLDTQGKLSDLYGYSFDRVKLATLERIVQKTKGKRATEPEDVARALRVGAEKLDICFERPEDFFDANRISIVGPIIDIFVKAQAKPSEVFGILAADSSQPET